MSQTSQSRRWCTSRSTDHTRKADTDHQACLLIRVSTQLTFTFIAVRFTNGADAVTHRLVHSAMVSANGLLPDAAQSTSTCRRADTISCVIASLVPMHHSATARINMCSNGLQSIIEASGVSQTCAPGGPAWATGCSPSTSERKEKRLATWGHQRHHYSRLSYS
jgi:hypothetical protein